MKQQYGNTSLEVALVVVVVLGIGGWIGNIVKIFGAMGDTVTGLFIARCVGAFIAPIGAVLGYV